MEALASCHCITYVHNELIGDPLEVKMFQSTEWILEEPNTNADTIDEIVHAYVKHPKESSLIR